MSSPAPHEQLNESRVVEARIRHAFHGITRNGGRSWHQSMVIDELGTIEETHAARALDGEGSWEDLVDDPSWEDRPGIGGFCLLDGAGTAYYIAPAMIRCLRNPADAHIPMPLTLDETASECL